MLRRLPVWVAIVALWGGSACTRVAPVPPPEEVVKTFIAAAAQGDWGTADSYLTERFSRTLRPGSLPSAWALVGDNPRILSQVVTGKTAYVWVEGIGSLEDFGQRLGLDPLTLRNYLTKPDPADPNYQQLASQLVAMRLEGDKVISQVKITLYQQESGWRIEVWQPGTPEQPAAAPTSPSSPDSSSEDTSSESTAAQESPKNP